MVEISCTMCNITVVICVCYLFSLCEQYSSLFIWHKVTHEDIHVQLHQVDTPSLPPFIISVDVAAPLSFSQPPHSLYAYLSIITLPSTKHASAFEASQKRCPGLCAVRFLVSLNNSSLKQLFYPHVRTHVYPKSFSFKYDNCLLTHSPTQLYDINISVMHSLFLLVRIGGVPVRLRETKRVSR